MVKPKSAFYSLVGGPEERRAKPLPPGDGRTGRDGTGQFVSGYAHMRHFAPRVAPKKANRKFPT